MSKWNFKIKLFITKCEIISWNLRSRPDSSIWTKLYYPGRDDFCSQDLRCLQQCFLCSEWSYSQMLMERSPVAYSASEVRTSEHKHKIEASFSPPCSKRLYLSVWDKEQEKVKPRKVSPCLVENTSDNFIDTLSVLTPLSYANFGPYFREHIKWNASFG